MKRRSPSRHTSTHEMLIDRQRSIAEALIGAGIEPVDMDALLSQLDDAEGKPVRFSTANKPRRKNGWIIAYSDQGLPFVVVAGDWSTGTEIKWVASSKGSVRSADQKEFLKKIEKEKAERQQARNIQWEKAAAYASNIFVSSLPADPNHPYLLRKGILPHKARQQGPGLVLPLMDFSGKIWSIQRIDQSGNKRFLAGARKSGNFIFVDGPEYPSYILICEGWATGCTLAESDRSALVLAAVDAGNLKAVALGARRHWPSFELIICGDDDRMTVGNPGATAARSAAIAAGGQLALPAWPPGAPKSLSDFNDLHEWSRGHHG